MSCQKKEEVLKRIASFVTGIETGSMTHAERMIANILEDVGMIKKTTNEYHEKLYEMI